MKNLNPGVSSLICGIVSNVLNCIMTGVTFFTGSFLYGGIFIIVPILGIVNAAKSFKLYGPSVMAIIGIVLNVIGTIGAAIFILIGIFGRFFG